MTPSPQVKEMNSEDELAYKHFYFPLNVYALALQLEEGCVESLHYGLFEHENEAVSVAQKRSTALLFSHLPEAPAKILEVGCGLGTTFKQMESLGYQVTGINPDVNQVQVARKRLGDEADLVASRLEDFDAPAGRYDVVLFQESAQYINPLDIFERSFDLLAENGELLILDEVCLRPEEMAVARLHLLESMLSVAKRCGFELIEHIDLSHQAVHTLNYLLKLVDKYRENIEMELGIDDEVLTTVRKINRDYKQDYEAGVYGYFFLHFRKLKSPKWHVGLSSKKHVPDIQKLFSAVFNEKMSDAFWHWKYGNGCGEAVLAWKGEKLVAHYGGMSRKALFFGEPCMICQNGDVMVDPSERGALTRSGPFFLSCASYLELFIGYGKKHLLGYGFPNRRAMKVAERLGLYEEVDTISEVRWQVSRNAPKLKTRIRSVDPLLDQGVIHALWLKMKGDLNSFVVGVRDFAYIQHRYFNHPEKEYQVLLLTHRFGGAPCALVILRVLDDECELVDYVGSLQYLDLAIDQAKRMTSRWQKRSLFCWITTHQASRILGNDGAIKDLDISIPCNAWSDGPKASKLNNRWWLMSGDTDFR